MSNRKIVSCGYKEIDHAYFNWTLTNACNFRCEYCIAYDSLTSMDQINAKKYKIALATLGNMETTFDMCLTGGEPTFHPHLKEIIEGLDSIKNSESIMLFTNLTQPNNYYRVFDNISPKLYVYASFHPTYYEVKKFVEKCRYIKDNVNVNFRAHVTLHDNKDYWQKSIDVMEKLKLYGIDYKPCLLQTHMTYTVNYTDEFYEKFDDMLESVSDDHQDQYYRLIDCSFDDGTTERLRYYQIEQQKLNNLKGFKCTSMMFNIDEDGFTYNACTGKKQSLLLKDVNLKRKVTCPNDTCTLRGNGLDYYKEMQ